MTPHPFRDLFVELPRAVFETLQAIGEAAVEKARRTPLTLATMSHVLKTAYRRHPVFDSIAILCRRHGWRRCVSTRRAATAEIEVAVTRGCGHTSRLIVDEVAMAAVPDAADHLSRLFEGHDQRGRGCFCVQPEVA